MNKLISEISRAHSRAVKQLLAKRNLQGYWTGRLSDSALSTATAVTALYLASKASGKRHPKMSKAVESGLQWLALHQNKDGGWGDTVHSFSNISTTLLCWAAFGAVSGAEKTYSTTVCQAETWIREKTGSLAPKAIASAVLERYGKDRTFSVPILTMCALAGRMGTGRDAWKYVIPLPFELASLPPEWFAAVRLPVVSYALPALIAIGQVRHDKAPSRNLLIRGIRNATRRKTLSLLEKIQPTTGGYLEATPLTSFVLMSLAGANLPATGVAEKATDFLVQSQRKDGAWPIDTDLATWVTTLSVNAIGESLPEAECQPILQWLLGQQYKNVHPYTQAAPGGWAWTDLPGGVPDADDTPGALIALYELSHKEPDTDTVAAAKHGIQWLLQLQNTDGGIPTFCHGWGALPFDQSSPDLTAHTLRAMVLWQRYFDTEQQALVKTAIAQMLNFLSLTQSPSGAWHPLWFGNQHAPNDINPVYGTSRVLLALASIQESQTLPSMGQRAATWLMKNQNPDGGWGGVKGSPSSLEETSLALEALASTITLYATPDSRVVRSIKIGAQFMLATLGSSGPVQATPIGFYFAKLWYYEDLYPHIYSTAALGAVKAALLAVEHQQ